MSHTAPRAISLENHMTKKSPVWWPYASSDRGRKTRTALLEKGVRNEANAAINAFSLRQKNFKTQRSYDKMLIDWVRSGLACVAAGPRTHLNHLYSICIDALYRRFRASVTQASRVGREDIWLSAGRTDLEPNISPSGRPTLSISTYNSRRNTNLKNFTFRISWLPDIYESIDLC